MLRISRNGQLLSWNLNKRTIWLDSKISRKTYLLFQELLDKLNQENSEDIFLFNSGDGGDFFACLDIINSISRSKSKIVLIALNSVASGAFLLTQANYKRRLAVAGTKFTFHQLRYRFLEKFDIDEFTMGRKFHELALFEIAMTNALQVQLYSKRGAPSKQIWRLLEADKTIGTRKAKELKLIDQVISEEELKSLDKIKKRC